MIEEDILSLEDLNIGGNVIEQELVQAIQKQETKIRVYLERVKGRRVMTIIEGIEDENEGEKLVKQLKKKLACGGTYKDGKVMLQGDHRRKIVDVLSAFGYPPERIEVIY